MKPFYTAVVSEPQRPAPDTSFIGSRARVAVYDAPAAAPRVVDVEVCPVPEFIEALSSTVYRLAQEMGGSIPYSVVREVSENFIHADFAEPVVSILDGGHTIRFADRGPGIVDKDRAVLPGFTTATGDMKQYIRGVGSGLPLVKDFLGFSGGGLVVEDNLGHGAVITVSSGRVSPRQTPEVPRPAETYAARSALTSVRQDAPPNLLDDTDTLPVASPVLTTRQKQVLALVMESGSAGPSLVSKELNVGISTAYRDLASLEEFGLIEADGGKRNLTTQGLSYLDSLTSAL